MIEFDFLSLPPADGYSWARIRCPMCAHTWELQFKGEAPAGAVYRSHCGSCGRDGEFRTPQPSRASRPVHQA